MSLEIKRGRPKQDQFWRFSWKYKENPETGCWVWRAAVSRDGYGSFSIGTNPQGKGSTAVLAHRYSYEHFKGPIPQGLEVDHICFNRLCVNPDHLEAVEPRVNEARMRSKYYSK